MCPASRRHQAGPGVQRGMTLIEALAAFVILSVGLLGIVSLQALSKTAQHQSIQRSRAVALGNDMLERIRSNPAGLETYDIHLTPEGDSAPAAEPNPDCVAAPCTPAQLATHDLWRWDQALRGAAVTITEDGADVATAGLIEPRGCIVFDEDAGKVRTGRIRVIIQWRGLTKTRDGLLEDDLECGDAVAAADEGYRRQLIVSSYVIDEAEL